MLQLNFTPFPEIATARLVLRKLTIADAADFLAVRSNENVIKYIDKEPPQNIDEAKALIEKITTNLNNTDGITWGICLKENKEQLIGTVGFWQIIKPHYRAEIGYMLHPDFWKKGLMKEAVDAALDFAFNTMKLHSIQANINPHNAASAALLNKLNFEREAYFKEDYFYRGQFLDSAIYSLLNK